MIAYCAPKIAVTDATDARLVLWFVLGAGLVGAFGGVASLTSRRLPRLVIRIDATDVRWSGSYVKEQSVLFCDVEEIAYDFWDPTLAVIEFRKRGGGSVRLESKWLDAAALENLLAQLTSRAGCRTVQMSS
jgi:hypothetical protein